MTATAAAPRYAAADAVAHRAPRLGVVSISRTGRDGVSYVARLVTQGVRELYGRSPWTADLDPRRAGVVTPVERAMLYAALIEGQLLRRAEALLFNHLGVARAQRWVPTALRRPYAVFVHGVEISPENMSPDRLEVLAGARLRIANSAFTARRFERLYPDVGPVRECPLALLPTTPPEGAADAKALEPIDSPNVALIVGRMSAAERYKGHDQLIEAWPHVLAVVPDAQLVIVGGGDDAIRLARKATDAGLGDRVLFTGRVSDATLDALFARASLFAMPSTGEGFGLVYLEAMRAGLPCIASPDDGGADVVVDGETGVLVRQADVGGLARAMVDLLRDPARAKSLGAAGRARYEAEFTFDRFRDRLGRLLDDAFGAHSAGAR